MFLRRKRSPDFSLIDIHPSFLPSKKGRPRNPSAFPRASGPPGLPGARWGKPSKRVFPKSDPRRREGASRGGPSNPIWSEGRSWTAVANGSGIRPRTHQASIPAKPKFFLTSGNDWARISAVSSYPKSCLHIRFNPGASFFSRRKAFMPA